MTINAFIPQVWSARLMQNLRNQLVFAQPGVINRDYEGDITEFGQSVRLLSIGKVSVGDYTKNTDFSAGPQVLDDASQALTIDRSRYFNFFVDDIDRAQQRPKMMDAAMQEAAFAMANDLDGYISALHPQAGVSIGTDAAPRAVGLGASDVNAYEQIVDISVRLDEENAPPDGRYCIVPPWFYGFLLKDQRFVSFGTDANRATISNGVIGEAAGMTILRSNQVQTTTNGTRWKIMAGHSMAITFASQVSRTEAYRPERRFGDAMKGLALYGAKVVRPSLLCATTVSKA